MGISPLRVILALFLMMVPHVEAGAASRGIVVNLRAAESVDAPIAGTVELYAESYALVIGIDEYNNGWPKLSNAIKDAELVASQLELKGFNVELHKNLNSSQLSDVFKRFFILKGDNPNARLFIWFAGHGATVDGEGYLIPANAPTPNMNRSEFKFASVALRDFGTYMRQAVSKHVYAVFDSCFAGTVFSSQRALPPAAITRATTMPVRQFLTSGDADQTVSDDGTFRELFLRAINGDERADANGDGYVTASELGMFLGDRVTNLTQSLQTPRFGKLRDKNFDRGDFVFVLPEGAVANALPIASGMNAGRSAEIAFWNSIKDSDSAGQFEAYLKQYPDGAFTSLAMVRKSEIERSLATSRARAEAEKEFKVEFIDLDMQASRVANIRETPFPTAERVGQLEAGAFVWAVGQTNTPGGTWYQIARDGVELGFVYGPLLDSVSSTATVIDIAPIPIKEPEVIVSAPVPSAEPRSARDQLSFLVEDLLQEVTPLDAVSSGSDRIQITQATEVAVGARGLPQVPARASSGAGDEVAAPGMEIATVVVDEIASKQTLRPAQDVEDAPEVEAAGETEVGEAAEVGESKVQAVDGEVEVEVEVEEAEDGKKVQGAPEARRAPSVRPAVTTETTAVSLSTTALDQTSRPDETVATEIESPAEEVTVALTQAGPEAVVGQADAEQVDQTATADKLSQLALLTEQQSRPEPSAYLKRYIRAAEGGNAKAQLSLGYMYQTGEHVSVDTVEAIRWYRKAAAAGEVDAMISLALIYESGEGVGSQDMTEAARWYREAASLGHADAQQSIGYLYETGTGVTQDAAEAARWYEKAAGQGRIAAQNNLGRFYQLGIGVPQDLDKAVYWYEQAAAQGSEAARSNLDKLIP